MLSLSSSTRYFLCHQATDLRCGGYSLAGLVTNQFGRYPLSGDLFIFIGKSANQSPADGLVFFDYQKSRDHPGPEKILKDFQGVLQTDAYKACQKLFN